NEVFILHLSNLRYRQPLILLLQVWTAHFLGDKLGDRSKQVNGLIARSILRFHRLAGVRLRKLRLPLLYRAYRSLTPDGAIVKQVPVFQGKRKRHPHCGCLPKHPNPFGVSLFQQLELGAVELWKTIISYYRIVQHRPSTLLSKLRVEGKVALE